MRCPDCGKDKVYTTERALILDPDRSVATRLAASKPMQRRLKRAMLLGTTLLLLSFGLGITLGGTIGIALGGLGFLLAIGAILFWFNLEQSAGPNNPRVRRYECRACGYKWFLYRSSMDLVARWLEGTLQRHRHSEHRALVANLLVDSGRINLYRGDLEQAAQLSEDGLTLYRELQDEHGVAGALDLRGTVRLFQGDLPAAEEDLRDSLAMAKRLEDWKGIALARTHLALLALEREDEPRAHLLLQESLALNRTLQHQLAVGWDLVALAELAIRWEEPALATRAGEVASRLFEEAGWPLPAPLADRQAAVMATAGEALGEQALTALQQEMSMDASDELVEQLVTEASETISAPSADTA